jgi:hypothetical protein
MADTSRVNREIYARFCGGLVVKFLRSTRRKGGDNIKVLPIVIISFVLPDRFFGRPGSFVFSWIIFAIVGGYEGKM